jgi:hypothetical protein
MADQDDVFDVIVIGAGPAGFTTTARRVRGDLSAMVVEERLAGGECEYFAYRARHCSSKALLWPIELAAEVGRMPGLAGGFCMTPDHRDVSAPAPNGSCCPASATPTRTPSSWPAGSPAACRSATPTPAVSRLRERD